MRIIDKIYFDEYSNKLQNVAKNLATFLSLAECQKIDYQLNVSAVYSSNIEGNPLDVNSFINSITNKTTSFKEKNYIDEIKDLAYAYDMARTLELTESNFISIHSYLSKTILIKDKRGVYRTDKMGIFDDSGLVYFAVEAEKVTGEMKLLFKDIHQLIETNLTAEEAFYHASLIHLKLAQIHPFWDGNGRSARLLEKWFLTLKVDIELWKLPSEKFYKENLKDYYNNINLGKDYYSLSDDSCLPFLYMLPKSLNS